MSAELEKGPMTRPPARRILGVTVLDALALVLGGALASVHVRGRFADEAGDGVGPVIALAFIGLSLTAAGPFLFWSRRLGRGPRPRHDSGLTLWAALGFPWCLGGAIEAIVPGGWAQGPVLVFGLVVASLFVVFQVWTTWVRVPGRQTGAPATEAVPWTDHLGTALAVAWPLQFSLVLVFSSQR